jgi:hypothetical protein
MWIAMPSDLNQQILAFARYFIGREAEVCPRLCTVQGLGTTSDIQRKCDAMLGEVLMYLLWNTS